MNSNHDDIEKCVGYFRSRPGFERLFLGIRDKYISLSYFGGNVKLTSLTSEEKEALEGFFQKPYHKNRTVTISVEQFQRALGETKFAHIKIEDIIEGYFGESLESKKEQKRREEQQWNKFLDRIESGFQDTFSLRWFRTVRQKGGAVYSYIRQFYHEDPDLLFDTLTLAMQGADAFPVWEEKRKRLDIFAADITGNPHFFDVGTKAHRLLFYLIEAYLEMHPIDQKMWELGDKQYEVEKRMEWMFQVGLLSDEISNRTVTYGVHLRKRNGKLHEGMEGFWEEKEPATIMLCQMRDVVEALGESEEVYVFENPSVFSVFIEKYKAKKVTAVCTSGQLMFTSLLLLDLLVKGGCVLYYSGDFDPEGLQIGDKLKGRYQDKLVLWHYRVEDYVKAKSDKVISKGSLTKLDKIQSVELSEVVECMRREKVAGYQEALAEEYEI
ncbi:TIGR02679 family protein [[Clostridium] polysaccharolyticum]|uniref:TIGR02679 family protein n=1 Tax=[Clostridium] polysaccharolyticum TaxID=29364 RepID=A0A1H9ZVB2_9FIRM|nr:TIGR02679 family protein [[Clostridium] polysaccharolyticum]SES85652.1 TIGR02679 family protein [[Clostridium] polysaccharolyticum]